LKLRKLPESSKEEKTLERREDSPKRRRREGDYEKDPLKSD
jgi:hypothetical protein